MRNAVTNSTIAPYHDWKATITVCNTFLKTKQHHINLAVMCLRSMVDHVQSLLSKVTDETVGKLEDLCFIKSLTLKFILSNFDFSYRLCSIHSRKEELKRQKSSLRHYPSPSTESLLTGLTHYVPSASSQNIALKEDSSDEPLDPFCKSAS